MQRPPPPAHLRSLLSSAAVTFLAVALFWGTGRVVWKRLLSEPISPPSSRSAPPPARRTDTPLAPAGLPASPGTSDTDTDGLPDTLEPLYGTDPYRADTDGDGYVDGSEVANGYDPTIPAPNDKVRDVPPAASPLPSSLVPLPSSLSTTQRFLQHTGLTPTREVLSQNSQALREFIDSENARGYLPTIPDSDITTTSASGKGAIAKYLDAISIPQNRKLERVDTADITQAFQTLVSTKKTDTLDGIIGKLETNIQTLKIIAVPTEAVPLHKKYLAASLALLENTKRLRGYQQDTIGTLVAASRIEGLRPVFQETEASIKALEKKYTIQ